MSHGWAFHNRIIFSCWIAASFGAHLLLLLPGTLSINMEGPRDDQDGIRVELLESVFNREPAGGATRPSRHSRPRTDSSMLSGEAADGSVHAESPFPEVTAFVASVGGRAGARTFSGLEAVRVVEQVGEGVGVGAQEPVPTIAAPVTTGNQRPNYPQVAQKRGWEGEVMLWVLVSPFGEAIDSGVEKSSGYSVLDQSALRAVRSWRFHPAALNGVFVESRVYVPVVFQLQRI